MPSDAKSRLIGKDPDARKDGGQEEKGATEDEIVGWHPLIQWTIRVSKLWEIVKEREDWYAAVQGVAKSQI